MMRNRMAIVDIATRKFKALSYKQYDTNNILQIVVMENNKIVDISSYNATIYFKLPSEKTYRTIGIIKNNTINVTLSSSVLKEYGKVILEVKLSNGDEIVTTFSIYLNVEKSIDSTDSSDADDDPNLEDIHHTHNNKKVLDQITQEMIDTIVSDGGFVDLTDYQTKSDATLTTTNKTVVGAINELEADSHTHTNKDILDAITSEKITSWNNKAEVSNIPTKTSDLTNDSGFLTSIPSEYITETELDNKGYLTEHQDISGKADKSEIPTKVSQLTNDSNFTTQPNFTFEINMIASTEQPNVVTNGTYPNLVVTFNIPQGVPSNESGKPIYYGRLSISEVGGSIVQYNSITDTMIKNGSNITKITSQTLDRTSVGKQNETSKGDYIIVAVPNDEGYIVKKDNGLGGKIAFDKDVVGANGVILNIDGNEYAIYGEILISPAEIFIYINKN